MTQDLIQNSDIAAAGPLICANGHRSTETDFCSECGLKLTSEAAIVETTPSAEISPAAAVASFANCPSCQSCYDPAQDSFCENCGYNFTLGIPSVVSAEAEPAIAWALEITVDPSLRDPQLSPETPERPAETLRLQQPKTLLGRTHRRKAIYPDLALDFDNAISCRHVLITIEPNGELRLRDLGSSNGTWLKGQLIPPMTDHPLQSGDSFTLGHWTRITVLSTAHS